MTERWAVDASVVAKFYLKDEDYSDVAAEVLNDFGDGLIDLIGPQFLLYEVASAILGAVRRRRLDDAAADDALRQFRTLGVRLVGDEATLGSMVGEAYDLARRVGCGLYDALYLAVGLAIDLPLITGDARFYRNVSSQIGTLVWIGDYQSRVQTSR